MSTVIKEVPAGSVLFGLEDANATFVGFCQPVGPHDPSPGFDVNGFIGVMQPIRVVQGVKAGPAGPERVFNPFPASVIDWVDVLFIRPTRYYLAGPATTKIHRESWAAFLAEYERDRAEGAGVLLVTSDQVQQIAEMHDKMRRH